MYNPEQPRDERGRWTKTKAGASFLGKHSDELAIGATIVGAAFLTRGVFVKQGLNVIAKEAPQAAKALTRAATVRKVGPVNVSRLKTPIKTVEGWQYHRGLFSSMPDDKLVPIGRRFKDLKVGAELVGKRKTKVVGAAKPIGYNTMSFKNSPGYTYAGAGILGIGAAASQYKSLKKK